MAAIKTKFIKGGRPSAPRISEEVWESWKSVLVEAYRVMTLPEVMTLMKQKHGFTATKRQYVHRFQTWKVRKYRPHEGGSSVEPTPDPLVTDPGSLTSSRSVSPTPPLFSTDTLADLAGSTTESLPPGEQRRWMPQLDTAGDWVHNPWLADVLYVLGDFHHSFVINNALWKNAVFWKREPSNDYIVACVRTAQTQEQAQIARHMVKTSHLPEDDDSWASAVFDFLLAYTYDWRNDATHGMEQLARAIPEIVPQDGQGQDCLRKLAPRGPRLDVQTFILFRAALIRYNQTHQDGQVYIPEVLHQFIHQQRAVQHASVTDPLLHIDCLPSCLRWCIDALSNKPSIPLNIPRADDDPVAEAYALLCTLWKLWLDSLSPPSPPSHAETAPGNVTLPAWAENTRQQLGISPTELLSTVVCMIVAAVPQQVRDAGEPLWGRALAGAWALRRLDSGCLIQRFLDQVWASNRWLAFRSREVQGSSHGAAHVEIVETARRFVAEALGVDDLPALERGMGVHPLVVLADAGLDLDGY